MAICSVCGKDIKTDMDYHLQSYHYWQKKPGTASSRYLTKAWLPALLNILPLLAFFSYFWFFWRSDYLLGLLIIPLGFGFGYLYLRRPGRFALAVMGGTGASCCPRNYASISAGWIHLLGRLGAG